MNDYFIIKLTTGDEIMGTIEKDTRGETIKIHNPLLVITVVTEDGLCVIYLRRYASLSKTDMMHINKSTIVTTYEPAQALIDYYDVMLKYIKKFVEPELNTGIETATKILSKSLTKKKKKTQTVDAYISELEMMSRDKKDPIH